MRAAPNDAPRRDLTTRCGCCGQLTLPPTAPPVVPQALAQLAHDLEGCHETLWRFLRATFAGTGRDGVARHATLAELSADLGVNTTTLASRFTRRGLPSPGVYFRHARSVLLADALAAPNARLAETAYRLGWGDAASAQRSMRTMFGLSLGELRARHDGASFFAGYRERLIVPYRDALRSAGFAPLVDARLHRVRRR